MADPWFKFFPSDWRNDPALKMCSMAARGLWIELICLMHQANPYGHLLVNGQAPTDAQLAVLVGAPSDQIAALLGELESAGIFSRTRNGVVYSRKLTRMAKKAATARNNGRKGGNPSLSKESENKALDNPQVKGQVKPQKPEPEPDMREDTNVSLSVRTDATRQAVARYNQAAERAGWPQVQKLTQNRSKQLRARLKDCGGLEGWEAALRRAFASEFCRGRTSKPWTGFGFDWLIKAANFTKLMEGNYDNRSDNRIASNGPENGADPARDQILRLTGLSQASSDGGSGTGSDGEEDGSVWLGAGSWDAGTRQADEGLDFGAPRLSVVGGTGRMSGMG